MTAAPSISIIVVTLNEMGNLPGLFASLRAQTDREFDLLIVDGQSKDETFALVQESRDIVTYCVSEPDFGFYDALNKGIRAARTDFYLVVGADDRLEPTAIADFRAVASCADIVVAGVRASGRIRQGCKPQNAWLGPSRTLTSHSVGTLIRTRLHRDFGYYSLRYPILADWHFLKRALTAPGSRVAAGSFLAGTFATGGLSTRNFVRTLCELWLVQRETGESAAVQYLLFQMRLLYNIRKVVAR